MTKVIEKNDIRGRRRQAILTAAAEEFWQSGFEHARMDAIAARAGIGKSTIYEYFSSKTALLSAVGEQMAGRAAEEIGRILRWSARLSARRRPGNCAPTWTRLSRRPCWRPSRRPCSKAMMCRWRKLSTCC